MSNILRKQKNLGRADRQADRQAGRHRYRVGSGTQECPESWLNASCVYKCTHGWCTVQQYKVIVITKTGLPEENETNFKSNFITGSKLS